MYANGAISITFFSRSLLTVSKPKHSYNESYNGCKYGSIFSARSPGKKPSFSPASIAGLTRIIFLTSRFSNAFTAHATAKKVFPVPAAPIPKVTVFVFIVSMNDF